MFSTQGEDTAWVTVDFVAPNPSGDDWIGIFSPSNFKYTVLLFSDNLNTKFGIRGYSFL